MLRDMIDRTLYAVSQDEKKPAHTGELFEIETDKMTIVALDGYRLAIVERPVTAVKDIRIIVPSKTMTEVSHLLPNDDEEPVHICANRRYVVFMTAGYTIMSLSLIHILSLYFFWMSAIIGWKADILAMLFCWLSCRGMLSRRITMVKMMMSQP